MTRSNRIQALRWENDITLRQMAGALGLHYSYLSRLERGLAYCSRPTMRAIARYFNVPVETVFPPGLSRD